MRKESKSFKKIIFSAASAACLIPLAVSKIIFVLSEAADKNEKPKNEYPWSLGTVRYNQSGQKRPLLLIHDGAACSSSIIWQKNIAALSEHFNVYSLDLLGFGYSDKPKITYTAFNYQCLINDFIRDVIKRPTAVCAINESCAFALAAQAFHPENFTKLVLISPSGINDSFSDKKENISAMPLELPILGESNYLIKTSRSSIKKFLSLYGIFSKELVNPKFVNALYYACHSGGTNNRYIYSSIKGGFLKSNLGLHLQNIKKPILVIWGENNVDNPVDNLAAVRDKLHKKAEFIVFERTRLYPQYENPKEFNQIMIEFLSN